MSASLGAGSADESASLSRRVPRAHASLGRRALAEAVGSAALVAVVVGSGIQATELSRDVGVQLLANSLATVFGLGVLILLLGPVSGAHFNPVVTLAAWFTSRRAGDGLTARDAAAYVPAQIGGAVAGAMLADAMFGKSLVHWSTHDRSADHLLLGETVATAGLVLLIFGLPRVGRANFTPIAVASYIGAAYWFTSSTSFANPAVTIGRTVTNTFAGIAPSSAVPFMAAQTVGAAAGLALVTALFGRAFPVGPGPQHRHMPRPFTTTPISPRQPFPAPAPLQEDTTMSSSPAADRPAPARPSVLFVCVHNAGRSQMAAAFLTHLAGDAVEVRSAGSAPADTVNPAVVEAMSESGIDISAETPKILTIEAVHSSDVVITMGCGDTCPVFPGKTYLDWKLDDPAGQGVDAVRPIRDEIENRVRGLLADLGLTPRVT
ncbi:hypothetical protein GCM10010321_69590 [Streptomyces chartreusis]|nr:hypothetical protein GCM10010321_69590 [Streptomyces chartreusis]